MTNLISQTVPYQVDTGFSPFKASEFDDALCFLSGEGFTGVEIAVAYPHAVDPDELLSKLEAGNLAATTLSTGQIYGLKGLFLSSDDEDIRAGAIDTVKGHVDLSARIGRPHVTIGLIRGMMKDGDKGALLGNLRQALLPCFDYASKKAVTLQIEPVNRKETFLLNSVAEALDFIYSLGSPENAGILYDCYHSNIEDGDMVKAIHDAGKRITNIHLADSHRGLPGYGEIDFSAVRCATKEIGYSGAFALETLPVPDADFVKKNCFAAIAGVVGL